MKTCKQCRQITHNQDAYCPRCGSEDFDIEKESHPISKPNNSTQRAQKHNYQSVNNYEQMQDEIVTVKEYLINYLLLCIPLYNIVRFISIAIGGPKYKKSLTNLMRATLIASLIGFVMSIIVGVVLGVITSRLIS